MRNFISAAALLGLCAGCAVPPPPPAPELISQLTATVPADNPECREFRTPVTVNGQQQEIVGRACRWPDGSWRWQSGMGPLPVISHVTTQVAPDNPHCLNYSASANFGTVQEPIVGRSCELPDGSRQVTQGTSEQPAQVTIVYPPVPVPDYAAYDPWWWGPPFISMGPSFVVVDDHHHHFVGGHFHGGAHHRA
jgi:surface antigen